MEEQFEYGELVEVRDFDGQEWEERVCAGELPNCKVYWTMKEGEGKGTYDGHPVAWQQMRKIQKPEPALIDIEQPETIEQRMDKFEAVFNGAIKHINEQLESIKNQLK